MLQLFYQYCLKGKIKQALLVGHNIFNRNQDDKEVFEAYFNYIISLAEKSDILEAKSLIQQATGVLALFSENIEISEELVDFILKKEEKLNSVLQLVTDKEEAAKRESIKYEVSYHNDALALLEQLLEKISKCDNEKDFNIYINNLGRIDQRINRDRLSSAQENKYSELTKKSSEIVSAKMSSFEKVKNREYNLKAIESYEKIFNMFKNGKVLDEHKDILKGLFIYDASRLYNETLVYYNYVYNYVLGKLSDEDKFLMTKYAIMCEKMR